jgi:hypothetical protein
MQLGGTHLANGFERWPLRGERGLSPSISPGGGDSPLPLPSPSPRGKGETGGGAGGKPLRGTEATRRISHGDGSARRHVGSYTRADVAVCSNGVAPAPTRGDSSYMFTLRHFDAGTGHRLPARCGADRRHSRGPEISHKWTGMLVDTSSRGRVGLRHPCEEWDDRSLIRGDTPTCIQPHSSTGTHAAGLRTIASPVT